jgi:two-component system chemotaxis response regulator CheY
VSDDNTVRRVLIVEDSTSMRQLLAEAVERVPGVVIDQAGDGLSALIAIQRNVDKPYDLVLLDINMPVIDGLKLLGKLRGEPACENTRVCVVTSDPDEDTEEQVRELGGDYYLKKPLRRRDLEKVFADAVQAPASSG